MLTGLMGHSAAAVSGLAEIAGSLQQNVGADHGEFNSTKMTIDIVLAPDNQAELTSLLTAVYDQNGPKYQQWLASGEFESRFAPNAARVAELTGYLQAGGLTLEKSSSPFLLRVSG